MSQNQQILTHLKSGRALTTFGAFALYKVTRLASRVRELKDAGHDIKDRWYKSKGQAQVKQYYVNK